MEGVRRHVEVCLRWRWMCFPDVGEDLLRLCHRNVFLNQHMAKPAGQKCSHFLFSLLKSSAYIYISLPKWLYLALQLYFEGIWGKGKKKKILKCQTQGSQGVNMMNSAVVLILGSDSDPSPVPLLPPAAADACSCPASCGSRGTPKTCRTNSRRSLLELCCNCCLRRY